MVTKEQYLGLDDSKLVTFNSRNLKATPSSIAALVKLQTAALADGYNLEVASSWRSFERQFSIFDDKFNGRRVVLDKNEQPLDISSLSTKNKVIEIARFSAIPGFSRHHFGTDFDVFASNLLPDGQNLQLTAWEYGKGQYFYQFGKWLETHLEQFGFVRPFTGSGTVAWEPWHISYKTEADVFLRDFSVSEAISYLKSQNVLWTNSAAEFVLEHIDSVFGEKCV